MASPCSGHGFKFASAIGPLLADLAIGETPRFVIDAFRIDRFGAGGRTVAPVARPERRPRPAVSAAPHGRMSWVSVSWRARSSAFQSPLQ